MSSSYNIGALLALRAVIKTRFRKPEITKQSIIFKSVSGSDEVSCSREYISRANARLANILITPIESELTLEQSISYVLGTCVPSCPPFPGSLEMEAEVAELMAPEGGETEEERIQRELRNTERKREIERRSEKLRANAAARLEIETKARLHAERHVKKARRHTPDLGEVMDSFLAVTAEEKDRFDLVSTTFNHVAAVSWLFKQAEDRVTDENRNSELEPFAVVIHYFFRSLVFNTLVDTFGAVYQEKHDANDLRLMWGQPDSSAASKRSVPMVYLRWKFLCLGLVEDGFIPTFTPATGLGTKRPLESDREPEYYHGDLARWLGRTIDNLRDLIILGGILEGTMMRPTKTIRWKKWGIFPTRRTVDVVDDSMFRTRDERVGRDELEGVCTRLGLLRVSVQDWKYGPLDSWSIPTPEDVLPPVVDSTVLAADEEEN